MLEIFREQGFRFFFYSNEGQPREPAHIHVRRGSFEAKFWLRPTIQVAYNDGYDARTLRLLMEILYWKRESIERRWNEFFD